MQSGMNVTVWQNTFVLHDIRHPSTPISSYLGEVEPIGRTVEVVQERLAVIEQVLAIYDVTLPAQVFCRHLGLWNHQRRSHVHPLDVKLFFCQTPVGSR